MDDSDFFCFKTLGVPNLPIDMGLTRIGRLA